MPSEQVGSAYATIGLDSKNFESDMNSSKGKFFSFAGNLESKAVSTGKALGTALAAGLVVFTTALAGAGAIFGKSAMDWEKQMAGVFKTTNLDKGTAAANEMNDSLLELYSTMKGVNKGDITTVAEGLGSLGIANDQIKATTKSVLQASGAFGVSSETATDKLGVISQLWAKQTAAVGGTATMFDKAGSTVNELENKFASKAPNLLAYLSKAGGIAGTFNQDFQSTAAFGSLLETKGIKGEEAGTALRSMTLEGLMSGSEQKFDKKTGQYVGGGFGYQYAAQVLGIDDKTMKEKLSTDLYGTIIDISTAVSKLPLTEFEKTEKLKQIFGSYGFEAASKVAGFKQNFQDMNDVAMQGFDEGTSMSEEYERQTNNLWDSLGGLWNAVDAGGIKVFSDALGPVADKVNQLADWVRAATPSVVEFVKALSSGDWSTVGSMLQQGLTAGLSSLSDFGASVWERIGPSIEAIKPKIASALSTLVTGAGLAVAGAGMMALVPVAATMATGVIGSFITMSVGAIGHLATMAGQVALKYALMAGTATGQLVKMTANVIGEFLIQKTMAISHLVSMVPLVGAKYAMMAQAAVFNLGIMMTTSATKWGGMAAFAIMRTATMAGSVLAGYASMATGALASVATMITGTIAGFVSLVSAVALPVALVVAGLASIGYALDPGKFTIFNSTAEAAFNGISDVATDCWDSIQKGDWGAVGERLKQAFGDAISFVKTLDWAGLGGEVATMVVDGARAIIDGVFKLGDWIHDTVTGWISSGGPHNLGYGIADAIGKAISGWFNSDSSTSIWDALSSAWGTIKDWVGLGWQIVKGIGQGLLDRIYEAVQPTANKLLATLATAAYEVQGAFARAWNTILVGAANLVAGIYSVFSGVGAKIDEYLQPIKGEQSTSDGTIQGISYHDELIGGTISVEDYAKLPESEKKRYTRDKKKKSGSGAISIPVSQPTGVTADTTPSLITGGTSSTNPYLVGGTTSYSNVVNTLPLSYAGYRTGGLGFVSSELQSAGDGKVRMITDKGDFVTLTGEETVAKSIFDLIAPYTADYPTNTAEAGQAFADEIFPAATAIKESGEGSAKTTKEAAKEAAAITSNAALRQYVDLLQWAKSTGGSSGTDSSLIEKTSAAAGKTVQNEFDSVEYGLARCVDYLSDFAVMQEGVYADKWFNKSYIGETAGWAGAGQGGKTGYDNLAEILRTNALETQEAIDRWGDQTLEATRSSDEIAKSIESKVEDVRANTALSAVATAQLGSIVSSGGTSYSASNPIWGGTSANGGGWWINSDPTSDNSDTENARLNKYLGYNFFAGGGFSNQAAIFGEAGEEAAVPIADRQAGLRMLPLVMAKLGVRAFAEGGIVGGSGIASSGLGGGVSITINQGPITIQGSGDVSAFDAALERRNKELKDELTEIISAARKGL
ncbi:MAG: phage tail tape measure protein [Methanothrix sp.]